MNLGKEPSDLPTETEKLRLMLAFMTIKEPARREQLLSLAEQYARASAATNSTQPSEIDPDNVRYLVFRGDNRCAP